MFLKAINKACCAAALARIVDIPAGCIGLPTSSEGNK
jgi:hypothetical protein